MLTGRRSFTKMYLINRGDYQRLQQYGPGAANVRCPPKSVFNINNLTQNEVQPGGAVNVRGSVRQPPRPRALGTAAGGRKSGGGGGGSGAPGGGGGGRRGGGSHYAPTIPRPGVAPDATTPWFQNDDDEDGPGGPGPDRGSILVPPLAPNVPQPVAQRQNVAVETDPPPPPPTVRSSGTDPIEFERTNMQDFSGQTNFPATQDFGAQTVPATQDFGGQTDFPATQDFGAQTSRPSTQDFSGQVDFQPSRQDFGVQTDMPQQIKQKQRRPPRSKPTPSIELVRHLPRPPSPPSPPPPATSSVPIISEEEPVEESVVYPIPPQPLPAQPPTLPPVVPRRRQKKTISDITQLPQSSVNRGKKKEIGKRRGRREITEESEFIDITGLSTKQQPVEREEMPVEEVEEEEVEEQEMVPVKKVRPVPVRIKTGKRGREEDMPPRHLAKKLKRIKKRGKAAVIATPITEEETEEFPGAEPGKKLKLLKGAKGEKEEEEEEKGRRYPVRLRKKKIPYQYGTGRFNLLRYLTLT